MICGYQAQHSLECVEGKTQCIWPPEEAIKEVAVAEGMIKA